MPRASKSTPLQAAALTFSTSSQPGATTRWGIPVAEVYGTLQTTILLLADGNTDLCFISTACFADGFPYSNVVRRNVAAILGLERAQVALFSTHNHSTVLVGGMSQFAGRMPEPEALLAEEEMTEFGRALLRQLEEAARKLRVRLAPVTVAWAVGRERRISYNRKGRRADGSTYLMRDEDRVLLGADFNGDIDDEAPVVGFLGADGRPICFLVQFTAHPLASFHPEKPVVFGDYCQVACDDLSAAHGGVPVMFLQGCAGESNTKLFLLPIPAAERVANAVRFGHLLGETYIAASRRLQPATASGLGFAWQDVTLPFASVPSERKLRADLAVIEDFLRRVGAGDENLLTCLGINAARSMSLAYRIKVVEPYRRWIGWALRFHEEKRLAEAPKGVTVTVGAFRIGDIGLVGLPCEPLLGIGRQIRAGAPQPLTIPAGYMNDNIGYVPDSPNLGDTEFSSAFYRYTASFLPYRPPAGDLLARAGVRALRRLAR